MIHNDSIPAKNLIVSYYVKAFPTNIVIWVKRAQKATLQKTFNESLFVDKCIHRFKPSSNKQCDQASSSSKKSELTSKQCTKKMEI